MTDLVAENERLRKRVAELEVAARAVDVMATRWCMNDQNIDLSDLQTRINALSAECGFKSDDILREAEQAADEAERQRRAKVQS